MIKYLIKEVETLYVVLQYEKSEGRLGCLKSGEHEVLVVDYFH